MSHRMDIPQAGRLRHQKYRRVRSDAVRRFWVPKRDPMCWGSLFVEPALSVSRPGRASPPDHVIASAARQSPTARTGRGSVTGIAPLTLPTSNFPLVPKLALFRRGPLQVQFTITPFSERTCSSHRSGAIGFVSHDRSGGLFVEPALSVSRTGWASPPDHVIASAARQSPTPRTGRGVVTGIAPLTLPTSDFKLATGSEIGFVLPRPCGGPIRHNSFSPRHLPFPSLRGNWLCFARWVPGVAPATLPNRPIPVHPGIGFVSHAGTSAKLALFVQRSSHRLLTTDYRLLPSRFVSPDRQGSRSSPSSVFCHPSSFLYGLPIPILYHVGYILYQFCGSLSNEIHERREWRQGPRAEDQNRGRTTATC